MVGFSVFQEKPSLSEQNNIKKKTTLKCGLSQSLGPQSEACGTLLIECTRLFLLMSLSMTGRGENNSGCNQTRL